MRRNVIRNMAGTVMASSYITVALVKQASQEERKGKEKNGKESKVFLHEGHVQPRVMPKAVRTGIDFGREEKRVTTVLGPVVELALPLVSASNGRRHRLCR